MDSIAITSREQGQGALTDAGILTTSDNRPSVAAVRRTLDLLTISSGVVEIRCAEAPI